MVNKIELNLITVYVEEAKLFTFIIFEKNQYETLRFLTKKN